MTPTRPPLIAFRPILVATTLLGIATSASAMSLRLEVTIGATLSTQNAGSPISVAPLPTGPVRVSTGVMSGQIVSKIEPVYPPEAKEKGIQGTVILRAIIDKDGIVKELSVISGAPVLQKSAIEAVKQWVYKPYLLNGEPVEVETAVAVNYSLANPAPGAAPQPQAGKTNVHTFTMGEPIHAPVLIYAPNPAYSQAAREAKLSGKVLVTLLVDQNGRPQNVRVTRSLGGGLDEKAVEAVQQYRFKPATLNGKPVSANVNLEVSFQIF